METFGKILKRLRNEAHISQQKLAKEICVSDGIVSMWETDQAVPSFYKAKDIADYFDVSLDYLAGREYK